MLCVRFKLSTSFKGAFIREFLKFKYFFRKKLSFLHFTALFKFCELQLQRHFCVLIFLEETFSNLYNYNLLFSKIYLCIVGCICTYVIDITGYFCFTNYSLKAVLRFYFEATYFRFTILIIYELPPAESILRRNYS